MFMDFVNKKGKIIKFYITQKEIPDPNTTTERDIALIIRQNNNVQEEFIKEKLKEGLRPKHRPSILRQQ